MANSSDIFLTGSSKIRDIWGSEYIMAKMLVDVHRSPNYPYYIRNLGLRSYNGCVKPATHDLLLSTLLADNVGRQSRSSFWRYFVGRIFVGRQSRTVCQGYRHCRPTCRLPKWRPILSPRNSSTNVAKKQPRMSSATSSGLQVAMHRNCHLFCFYFLLHYWLQKSCDGFSLLKAIVPRCRL